MSPDPIQASLNAYGYASGDPVNRLDPTGLEDETWCDGNYCEVIGDTDGTQDNRRHGWPLPPMNPFPLYTPRNPSPWPQTPYIPGDPWPVDPDQDRLPKPIYIGDGIVYMGPPSGGVEEDKALALARGVHQFNLQENFFKVAGEAVKQGVAGGTFAVMRHAMAGLNAAMAQSARIGQGARLPGRTIDAATGVAVGRFVVDPRGNAMIEPMGGRTVSAGRGGIDTHTLYPNGSNYQRLNPAGHPGNPTPHGHGHLQGVGPGMRGQGPSIDPFGIVVPWNSPAAHWPIFW
jgi:hypothetical protein